MGGDAAEVSNLNITLHPLVVINISDHYTRARAQAAVSPAGPAGASTPPCVYGAILGEQVRVGGGPRLDHPPYRRPLGRGQRPLGRACKLTSDGEQVGRRVELANSFELKMTKAPNGADAFDMEYLRTRLEQYKKTYPKYDMLGWYCTRAELLPSDMELQARHCPHPHPHPHPNPNPNPNPNP